ncbi:hypothetical protein Mp_1g13120 [Marchantia polymorpha subsp. ruderalis]|uniref:Uncharacterized protein n=2 Tax=Marchantia polymorpha TaxID=3197 RepID=A0AAF6APL9_MARPO|nr:hypothetical protein MARPO_0019s0082 [Marchantia polymorpha]BBM98389.1 hypothetical protein Mp_1g13120 [Marchantia polymorpha subsp. ruderalis]|eukprot:PTQ44658.1 hypothetical protein MARPO_0019s0082 [Marchantia polymorpha]
MAVRCKQSKVEGVNTLGNSATRRVSVYDKTASLPLVVRLSKDICFVSRKVTRTVQVDMLLGPTWYPLSLTKVANEATYQSTFTSANVDRVGRIIHTT